MDFSTIKGLYKEHEHDLIHGPNTSLDDLSCLFSIREVHFSPEVTAQLERFQHIIDKICALWGNPALFDKYIDSLTVIDRPEGREGFPFHVMNEILAVQALHRKLVGSIFDFKEDSLDDIWGHNQTNG